MNNDGAEHRREVKTNNIYRWLKKNKYPQDGRFQVLCHNCNYSKAKYGLCPHQGPPPHIATHTGKKPTQKRDLTLQKAKHRELRRAAILAYGNKCNCCKEELFELLTIDHVNNDGAEHRKELNGESIYSWLHKNNYPQDGRFQVLCHNCNYAKAKYGGCPHNGLEKLTYQGSNKGWKQKKGIRPDRGNTSSDHLKRTGFTTALPYIYEEG